MQSADFAYQKLMAAARKSDCIKLFLQEELPTIFRGLHLEMSDRPSNIVIYKNGSFDYVFDAYQQDTPHDVNSGQIPIEARLVAAIGTSALPMKGRDDARLRGLDFYPMQSERGNWDRGHFIGHAIGGTVDGNEANVFPQLRNMNRGRYRTLEAYCRKNLGTLCFSRPIYEDTTAIPVAVEFGVLRTDNTLRVETLSNRREA